MTTLRVEAPVTILNTTIVDNVQLQDLDAVLNVDPGSWEAAVWLRGVSFARNNAALLVIAQVNYGVFSDTDLDFYSGIDGTYFKASAIVDSDYGFLLQSGAFFQTAAAVRRRALDASPSARHMSSPVAWRPATLFSMLFSLAVAAGMDA